MVRKGQQEEEKGREEEIRGKDKKGRKKKIREIGKFYIWDEYEQSVANLGLTSKRLVEFQYGYLRYS